MRIRSKHSNIARIIALALVSSFVLSACGIRGELERPPPLWGEKTPQETDKNKTDKQ